MKSTAETEARCTVVLEPGAAPFPRALATRLVAKLHHDPLFAASTVAMSGYCRVSSARDRRRADIELAPGVVRIYGLEHRETELEVTVSFVGGVCPESVEPIVAGGERREDLANWVVSLLYKPALGWAEAADEFWAAARGRSGGPESLRIRCTDLGVVRDYGESTGRPYEIHGPEQTLAQVLTGTLPLPEAAKIGRVHLRGSYRELSVLAGCCYDLLLGEVKDLD